MPKVDVAKIKSALKRTLVSKRALLLLAIVCLVLPYFFFRPSGVNVKLDGVNYRLSVASTPAKREKGLGGQAGLATNTGMLFSFGKPDAACIWMKDMHFSIDIIWLDSAKRVTHLEQNVSPQTYPTAYCPDSPVPYVIELSAGTVNQRHIVVGQKLDL